MKTVLLLDSIQFLMIIFCRYVKWGRRNIYKSALGNICEEHITWMRSLAGCLTTKFLSSVSRYVFASTLLGGGRNLKRVLGFHVFRVKVETREAQIQV